MKIKGRFFLSMFLLSLAAFIHILVRLVPLPMRTNTISLGLYCLVIVFWMEKNRQMILHRQVMTNLSYIAYLLIGYLFIRTLKYEFVLSGSSLDRYLWYGYYIILIAIGVFLFFSVLYIDKAGQEKVSPSWNMLFLLLFIFSLLFISNDFHQLIFTFPQGLSKWADVDYGYGPGFYLMVLYCGAIVLGTFFIASKKTLDSRNAKNIFLIFLVPVIWGLYTYLYLIKARAFYWFFVAFKSPEFNCLITISYVESLIYNRLMPVNLDYGRFWHGSSLDVGIMNRSGVLYANNKDWDFSPSLIRKAASHPVLVSKDCLLQSARVSNGYTYWLEDLSFINAIKDRLRDFGDLLAEENELLKAENRLQRDQASLRDQLEICAFIENALEDKFLALEYSLRDLPDREEDFIQAMRLPTIINVYIKRYANMLLLGKKSRLVDIDELRLAIFESFRYLNIFNIMTDFLCQGQARISLDKILLAYETFEDILEKNIFTMEAVFLSISLQGDFLVFAMEIDNPDSRTFRGTRLEDGDLTLDQLIEEGSLFVRAKIFLGSDFYDY
ncbi:MAG: hypothetical protein Q4E36_00265 [Bacillota bacterium]|nr:hypothetical protein [Bacillota bacterium]